MAISIHGKRGKKRLRKAKLSISGLASSPIAFDYIEKKQFTVEVPFGDDMHSLVNIKPLTDEVTTGESIRDAQVIAVSNVSNQAAVIKLKVPDWTVATDAVDTSAGASSNIQWLLKPGMSFILPGTNVVCSSTVEKQAANGKTEYAYDGAKKDAENEKPLQYNIFQMHNAAGTKFHDNTPLYPDMTAIKTDEKGGFNWDDQQTPGANLAFGIGDGKSGLFNHGGITGGVTEYPYYTPGSICIRFFDKAYCPWGLTDQTSGTKTGLAASTNYRFKLTLDGGAQQEILITTDANNLTWGESNSGTGLLSKINKALRDLAPWKDAANGKIDNPTLSIIEGDIVWSLPTAKRVGYSGSGGVTAIALANGTTGSYTDIWGVGSIPAHATITGLFQKPLFKELSRTGEMIFDDSYGNLTLSGKKIGEIDYTTGFTFFKGAAKQSSFEFIASYGGALSGTNVGDTYSQTSRVNFLQGLHAVSTNPMRAATLKVCAYTI